MEGMTIKEIAEISNTSDPTVRRWIGQTDKMADLTAKMAVSQGKEPARFTLPEVITIIKAGGKETLANLLQENADKITSAEMAKPSAKMAVLPTEARMDRLELMLEKVIGTMAQAFKALPQAQPALPAPIEMDYFSIKAYSSRCGVKVVFSDALRLGKAAVRLSRSKNIQVRKVDDEQFGIVNSYHVSVLKEIFTI